MALGKTADILMYAPFVSVFEVPDRIRKELTMDEFFKENGCYVHPNFDKQIEKLNETIIDNMTGDDWSMKISEVVESLKAGKWALSYFKNWLKSNGDGIFTILGDAGTGKSTFIHYLKWSKKDIQWHILDLKKSICEIKMIDSRIIIPRDFFSSLHGKIISSIILEIRNLLFERMGNRKETLTWSRKRIQLLLHRYEERIVEAIPLMEYANLYEQLKEIKFHKEGRHNELDYCKSCAKVITEYFSKNCFGLKRNRDTEAMALRCVLTHFLIFLRCFDEENSKCVIVFDNIERFIGADEIFNRELTDFLNDMRGFCDNYRDEYIDTEINSNRFSQKYQFIVSMRNTTVRNHTPAESADFKRHTIDLSSWFEIGEIIHAKLNWYKKRGIKVTDEVIQKHLEYILADSGPTRDQLLRGIRPKLDLFFNYNKRLIISFLTEAFESMLADHYLEAIETFYNIEPTDGYTAARARFGYRSVIWRSALDWLRKGALFQEEIFKYKTLDGQIADTNYVWKLLVVLHQFSTDNGGKETESRGTEVYMPFLDLISKVYNEQYNFISRFYESGFYEERERMARLLFYMNDYNREKNNWFQFIDIQYNVDGANRKNFNTWEDLWDIFLETKNNPKALKIRITTAGKAYLGYVATTFEFVSCMAGKLPLLCCLPSEKELRDYSAKEQKCIKVIHDTLNIMKEYIADLQLQADNTNLLYQRATDLEGQTYTERIVKSTYGYLVSFIDCLIRMVVVTDETAQKNKDKLTRLIISEAENLWGTYLPK